MSAPAETLVCKCGPADRDSTGDCEIHVSCDDMCGALENPVTLDEYKTALHHERYHGWLCGCSHGC